MNKSNAINVFTISPINAADTNNKSNHNNELELLPVNDKNIECNLLQPPMYLELRGFSIDDKNQRKFLVRAIFGWIILQNCVYLPVLYVFSRNSTKITKNSDISTMIWIIHFIISGLFYYFRNFRRPKPNVYFSFIFSTIMNSILMAVYASVENNLTVIFHPIILIFQLSAIIIYSLQCRLKLTNFRAFLIVVLIYVLFVLSNLFIFNFAYNFYSASSFSLFVAVYIIFDTQLILTSPLHNYQMTANEHVFGAVNLYADQSKLAWLAFRCFVLDNTVSLLRNFFKTMTSKLY